MSLASLHDGYAAAIFGASGGIGRAFVDQLAADPRCARVHAGARRNPVQAHPKVVPFRFDLTDPGSLEAAAQTIGSPDLVIIATGALHDENLAPEKSMRALDPAQLNRAFAINAAGPAQIARLLLPAMPRNRRTLFAAISARVGSISDNRLGGWHSYRASKAALNMLIRCFAIEQARTHPQAVCVALHPGTVDTELSKPFQSGVNPDKLFSPSHSASRLLNVLDTISPSQSGRLFAWDGQEIAP
jgi:NAD(P)-dependent dehydrogenase (short-subunit alcohol dehydrogenase family)